MEPEKMKIHSHFNRMMCRRGISKENDKNYEKLQLIAEQFKYTVTYLYVSFFFSVAIKLLIEDTEDITSTNINAVINWGNKMKNHTVNMRNVFSNFNFNKSEKKGTNFLFSNVWKPNVRGKRLEIAFCQGSEVWLKSICIPNIKKNQRKW